MIFEKYNVLTFGLKSGNEFKLACIEFSIKKNATDGSLSTLEYVCFSNSKYSKLGFLNLDDVDYITVGKTKYKLKWW